MCHRPVEATLACVTAALLACASCGGPRDEPHVAHDHAPPPPVRATPDGTHGASPEDDDPTAWAATPTPLAEELARAEQRSACEARVRASLSPDVAEVLADVGYGAIAADTCGALAAVRDGDARACDTLSISAVRRGCRRRVALVKGLPEACPDDVVLDGRDPVCVAWATRDPALCRAASRADAPRCEAVLANQAARCAGAPSAADCRAEVTRYGSLLATDARGRGAGDAVTPTFTLTLHDEDRTVTVDGTLSVARGVVVTACAGVRRVVLGTTSRVLREPPLFVDAPAPWLELARPEDVPGRPRPPLRLGPPGGDARLVVGLPHATGLTSDSGAAATVTLEALDATRGGRVAGTISGTLHDLGRDVRIEGRFDTFVRDVAEGGAACGG